MSKFYKPTKHEMAITCVRALFNSVLPYERFTRPMLREYNHYMARNLDDLTNQWKTAQNVINERIMRKQ